MENELSLIRCMKEVPDSRAPYNQKHKFLDIIIIAVTAILCGMDTWNEIKAIPELLEDISLYFKEEIFRREKKELEKNGL